MVRLSPGHGSPPHFRKDNDSCPQCTATVWRWPWPPPWPPAPSFPLMPRTPLRRRRPPARRRRSMRSR
ncbi:hypothetical protein [Lysobacter gummosus]|uniref:hypothetical protein n=1 Tax=Lysobacter gummosus TaxID=262324 RepID=UPI00363F8668